jgi:threonine dehydrogenase-like Zn-dependent dehydrogenase
MGGGLIMCADTGFRLETAEKLGAVPIDYKEEDVVEAVRKHTNGLGAKRVMEATGSAAGVRNACFATARGGCISVIGFPKDDVPIPVKLLVMDEIELVGNRANPNTLEKAIVIADRYRHELELLITHRFPLCEYARALDIFERQADNSLKIMLKPQQ